MATTRREYHYYYHGVDRGEPVSGGDASWDPAIAAVIGGLWVMAMIPVFGVGMLGAWAAEDRLPLAGGVHTVYHTNRVVAKTTFVVAAVVTDNIINGKSTFTEGW